MYRNIPLKWYRSPQSQYIPSRDCTQRFPPGKILATIEPMDWDDKTPFTGTNTIYPRSISFMDIDEAVFKWFNSRDVLISSNEKVPAYFLSPEKWAEFKKQ